MTCACFQNRRSVCSAPDVSFASFAGVRFVWLRAGPGRASAARAADVLKVRAGTRGTARRAWIAGRNMVVCDGSECNFHLHLQKSESEWRSSTIPSGPAEVSLMQSRLRQLPRTRTQTRTRPSRSTDMNNIPLSLLVVVILILVLVLVLADEQPLVPHHTLVALALAAQLVKQDK